MEIKRMHYSQYKNHYADCKTVPGSYDKESRSIEVILPEGRIYTHDANYMLKRLHAVCEALGLPGVRLHDLRHINASVGLLLGVPDKYMMERGGWSTDQTMKYRYQHTYASEKAAADDAINRHFEQLLKTPAPASDSGLNGNEKGNAAAEA